MEETLYEEGMEYPYRRFIHEDPVFIEFREYCERIIENKETTPDHKSRAHKVITLIDASESLAYWIEDLQDEIRSLEDALLYGPDK